MIIISYLCDFCGTEFKTEPIKFEDVGIHMFGCEFCSKECALDKAKQVDAQRMAAIAQNRQKRERKDEV